MSTPSAKPRIILGCMTFGPHPEHGARVTSLPDTTAIFSTFKNRGYTELDTARLYVGGAQERWTSDAGYRDLGFKIATKHYPAVPLNHTPGSLRETLEKSLEQLRTESVDIFYLHAPDRNTPFEVTLKAVDELHREGKFKQLGLSNYSALEVAEIAVLCRERGWLRPTIYQAMYNCITRGIEKELLPACRRYGLEVVVYNPIAGGLFSGTIKSPTEIPATGRFSNISRDQGERYRERYFSEEQFAALNAIAPVAEAHGITLLEVALRWAVHHSALRISDGRDGVIIGVSSLQQLEQNLEALEKGPLPEEVVAKVDEVGKAVRGRVEYWHGDLKWGYEWETEKV
ncbi:putative aflatoxin B1-aldehyde reductase [Ascodesmis nigricans]|uniref:Putative aflatoxin B1-aldehyde reductase n=1 Tax=Ascodesmis nigricans TaxID=341454 RepID=A0A4S2MIN4_9PEZI|nr:putative aflatoxin B1-aldehyde reductase [Ascodesmis nigricans]